MSESVTKITEQLVTPILDEKGLEFVDVEYVKEGSDWFLRVYIDSEQGVGIDECAAVSESLSEELDAGQYISRAYYLEVSSPGVERPLKKHRDFQQAIGKQVRIKTYAPIEDEKIFEGQLADCNDDEVTVIVKVKTREKRIKIPFDQIASARLAVTF